MSGETFDTRVAGIPCRCRVTHYRAARAVRGPTYCRRTGNLIDPGDPPEPQEFEFELLDRRGRPAAWLERKLTDDDHDRLLAEFKAETEARDDTY